MVPTGTGFRDHYRTRVKKNIDFGEIGSTVAFTPRTSDADLEALVAGFDPLSAEPSPMLAAAGGEVAEGSGASETAASQAGGAEAATATEAPAPVEPAQAAEPTPPAEPTPAPAEPEATEDTKEKPAE